MSYFRITTSPAPVNPEVEDSDLKEFYPPVNGNMAWKTIEPYILQAEELFIIPHIGRELYDELDTAYNDQGVEGDHMIKVFYFLRTALGAFIAYTALPELAQRLGDAGVRENANADSMPMRQWVYKENLWKLQLKAYRFLDKALLYLEERVLEGDEDFNTFAGSTTYTISRQFWISNASKFSTYFNIAHSRRTYVALRPYLGKVQELELRPLLGDDFYEELTEELVQESSENQISDANLRLIEDCRRYLAELTVSAAIGDLNFVQDGSGWITVENTNEGRPPGEQTAKMMQKMQTQAEVNASRFRIRIENRLYSNLDEYPTFRDSDSNINNQDDVEPEDPYTLIGPVDL